jgi:dienelactone hydrolase
MTRRRAQFGAALGALLLLASGIAIRDDVHGFTLLARAADLQGPLRRLADLDTVTVDERSIEVALPDAIFRGRVFRPKAPRYAALLVPGLHPGGIDEPRFVDLARKLAQANVTVVTVQIPELAHFEIVPTVTDRIEQSAAWLASRRDLSGDGRIALIGVSLSGGLAIVAAGRSSLRGRLRYVLSIGGYDDLGRVLDYLCGTAGSFPAGSPEAAVAGGPPHDYGAALVLLNVADRLVGPVQVGGLRDAARRFLDASYLDEVDKAAAQREFQALRDLAPTLPEPSATLVNDLNRRDVAALGPLLLPHVAAYARTPALSPSRSPAPSAPVFLLHGRKDTLIPASESLALAHRLAGHVPVHFVLTDLISHVEAEPTRRPADIFRVARFWGAVLRG